MRVYGTRRVVVGLPGVFYATKRVTFSLCYCTIKVMGTLAVWVPAVAVTVTVLVAASVPGLLLPPPQAVIVIPAERSSSKNK